MDGLESSAKWDFVIALLPLLLVLTAVLSVGTEETEVLLEGGAVFFFKFFQRDLLFGNQLCRFSIHTFLSFL